MFPRDHAEFFEGTLEGYSYPINCSNPNFLARLRFLNSAPEGNEDLAKATEGVADGFKLFGLMRLKESRDMWRQGYSKLYDRLLLNLVSPCSPNFQQMVQHSQHCRREPRC